MDDLLKDAIADAKAVRETALQNAKMVLEEAFTPKLQNMLSAKIQQEMDDDDVEEGAHEDDEMEEGEHEDDVEERAHKMARDGDEVEERGDEDMDEERDDEKDEGAHEDEVEEDEMEEGEHEDEEDDMEEDLDLEAIIKELEAEINEEDDDMEEGEERDDKDEVKEEDEVEEGDKEEMDENDVSSGIGKSDNAHDKKSGSSTDIGKAGKAKHESVDDDLDLDSILEALKEGPDEEEEEGVNEEVSNLRKDLDEARETIKFMQSKLNEVNLLNAKLLFTNKLFKKHGLSNEQKLKVVETFDRATNLREVKLVYSTLAESLGGRKSEIKESKGSASKAVASTKSEKQEVISEGNTMRDRFKKLANII